MWRRPWLLFGLGVLAIVVIVSTFAANALVRVQHQHQILRDLERLGAGYKYTDQEDPWHIPFAWQYPLEVKIVVDAHACDLNAVLELANQLTEVHKLIIHSANTLSQVPTDQIVSLTKLEVLSLIGAPITSSDLRQLGSLSHLRTLDIEESPLQYEEVVAWGQAHPACEVNWWPPLTPTAQAALTRIRLWLRLVTIHPHGERCVQRSCPWSVEFYCAEKPWADLPQIGNVRRVKLTGPHHTDLDVRQLSRIKTLRYVEICDAWVTPACIGQLAELPELQQVTISNCDVSAADLLRLRRSHPQIQLQHGCQSGPRMTAPENWDLFRPRRHPTVSLLFKPHVRLDEYLTPIET